MLVQQLISNGIHIDISIPPSRLQHLSVKPPQCHPAFQEYYDPTMTPVISEQLTNLMEQEYQQLYQDKMREISRYVESRQQTLQKHLNSRYKFQEIKQIRQLISKKNDLIEQHILLDAEIQAQERRIRIADEKRQYEKQAINIVIRHQIDQINREYDKMVEQFIEQMEQWMTAQYDLLKKQQIVKKQQPIKQTQVKSNKAAIWQQYYLKSKQIKEKVDDTLSKEQSFLKELSEQYMEQNIRLEQDFKKTLKMYQDLPKMPRESDMVEQLEQIRKYKKRVDQHGRREDKIKLKQAMETFQHMRQLRQKLKKTLKF